MWVSKFICALELLQRRHELPGIRTKGRQLPLLNTLLGIGTFIMVDNGSTSFAALNIPS